MQAERLSDPAEIKNLFEEKPFNGHKTSAEVLQMVCVSDKGTCYFADDLDVMDQNVRMCGLCKETRAAADAFFRKREEVTGQKPDTSYQDLPDRGGLFKALEMAMRGMVEIKAPKAPADRKAPPPALTAALRNLRQGR